MRSWFVASEKKFGCFLLLVKQRNLCLCLLTHHNSHPRVSYPYNHRRYVCTPHGDAERFHYSPTAALMPEGSTSASILFLVTDPALLSQRWTVPSCFLANRPSSAMSSGRDTSQRMPCTCSTSYESLFMLHIRPASAGDTVHTSQQHRGGSSIRGAQWCQPLVLAWEG